MDSSDLQKEMLKDMTNMLGKVNKYQTSADDEINKVLDSIPESEHKQFGEALQSQLNEVENVKGHMRTELEKVRVR